MAGSFLEVPWQYDSSEAERKESSAKADPLAVPHLQAVFGGREMVCLWQAKCHTFKNFPG